MRIEQKIGARSGWRVDHPVKCRAIGGRKCRGIPCGCKCLCSRQKRDGIKPDFGLTVRRPQHLPQMACKAKAGDVSHGRGAARKDIRSRAKRAGHRGDARGPGFAHRDPCVGGQARKGHFGGKDRAGAKRFGQQNGVAGPRATLGQRVTCKAGDGKPYGELVPDRTVTAHNIGAGGTDDGTGGRHHLGQHVCLQRCREPWQGDLRQNRLGCSPHRPDVPQGMGGAQPRHQVRIIGKGAQMVGRDDLNLIPGPKHGRVIARAGQHV